MMTLFMRFTKMNRGFTLIEVLVALCCTSLAVSLLVPCAALLRDLSLVRYESEDQIAIYQMRLLLAQGEQYQLVQDIFIFQYQGETNTFEYHNHRLVRRTGYEIFLQNIDRLSFQEKGDCYYVSWGRKQTNQEALLVCE